MCESGVIYLTLLNGTGYVFRVEDYLALREKHRVVGATVGKGWSKGWSVHELAMPVELTPWETQMLVDEGIAVLVSKKCSLLRAPTSDERTAYDSAMSKCREEQKTLLKAEKLRETERNMDKILAGKRKKMLREGVAPADIQLNASAVLDEIAAKFTVQPNDLLVAIPTAHKRTHAGEIVRPPTNLSTFKYHVFRDIWSRGKFVTGGDAFGADFLIYPGDPMLYHASHILITLPTRRIRITDFITKVRLSVIVNKVCTFAIPTTKTTTTETTDTATMNSSGSGEVESQGVCYFTIRWLGKRDKGQYKS